MTDKPKTFETTIKKILLDRIEIDHKSQCWNFLPELPEFE